MPDLSGCRAKLERAREHLQALHDDIADTGYRTTYTHRINMFGDAEVVVESIDQTPIRWATMIGDVIHNARSSLDHLVCALNMDEGADCEKPRTSFPVLWKADDWQWRDRDAWARKWHGLVPLLGRVRDADREVIESVQPFHSFWPNEDIQAVGQHPLAVLERLWNTDKHRLLAPGFFALAAVKATTPENIEVHDAKFAGISWRKAPLRLGEVAFTIHLAEQRPGARIEWHGELHPTVCFDDGQRVYETLDEAIRFAEGLVARFAR